MATFELEIFGQTSTYYELRLSSGGGPPQTRGLDKDAVDELVALVQRDYSSTADAQKVFGAHRLNSLGTQLTAFLDGDGRWLAPMLTHPDGAVLRITAEHRLRHLPWELLIEKERGFLSVAGRAPLLPVRAVGTHTTSTGPAAPGNRPLRVLFMAASPEGVEPVLNFEAEEAEILAATQRTGTDLVVEESGSLEGLQFLSRNYGAGHFDVLHLTGHATTKAAGGQPVFLMENEFGAPATATADQIAQAMQGRWPRLVFVSGCLTADSPEDGLFPSMSETLVQAGAPAVLGWALPVGDVSATNFAAALYQALADGLGLDQAVIEARRHLYNEKSPYWHLLRVYADRSPLAPMVTPLNTEDREPLQVLDAGQQFLDPQTQLSRVASRAEFVGRRRVIQRCLRALKKRAGTPDAVQGLVLAGMGGLGKSSLASRLLERMPTHQRAVWFGSVDLTKFRELTTKIQFDTPEQLVEATRLLDNDEIPLLARLTFLLGARGPLGKKSCLFVFDDFETGNLDTRADGSRVLSPEMARILPALLQAIRDTGSSSRVIITSRYRFPAPAGTRIAVEGLESLTRVEQAKKIANLKNLRPDSGLDPAIRNRAIEAADGNPRLLDWLDRIVADPGLDITGLLAAIEAEADKFRRETVLAGNLLDSQPPELHRMLAKVNVVRLPVPAATVHALHQHPDAGRHLTRAVELGLLEEGTDPETHQLRYYVSNVLHPLIRHLLTDDEYTEACGTAAESLHQLWVLDTTDTPR